jgi:hypothetical protein
MVAPPFAWLPMSGDALALVSGLRRESVHSYQNIATGGAEFGIGLDFVPVSTGAIRRGHALPFTLSAIHAPPHGCGPPGANRQVRTQLI